MMTIAIGTLLIFLLVVPGMAFRAAINFGPQTRKISRISAFDDFIWAIIPGIVFQFLGSALVNIIKPFGYWIDYHSLGNLLAGTTIPDEFSEIEHNIWALLGYNALLISVAAALGYAARKAIVQYNLDHLYRPLRFNNEWYYLLRGEFIFFQETKTQKEKEDKKIERFLDKRKWLEDKRKWKNKRSLRKEKRKANAKLQNTDLRFNQKIKRYLQSRFKQLYVGYKRNIGYYIYSITNRWKYFFLSDFKEINDRPIRKKKRNKIDTCTIYATVQTDNGDCYIYIGLIHSFYLAKDGTLDTIVLTGVSRQKFDDKKNEIFPINTNFHVLKNAEIIDLSVYVVEDLGDIITNIPVDSKSVTIKKELSLPQDIPPYRKTQFREILQKQQLQKYLRNKKRSGYQNNI